jgi:hypothetical protein
MSGVINTVIDSCAFPGSIAFSRFKAEFREGGTSVGALSAFQTNRYRDAGRVAAVTPGSICFHILRRLCARSRGVTLQKPFLKGNSHAESGFFTLPEQTFPTSVD